GKDAGLAEPRPVAHRRELGEAAPIVWRRAFAVCQPEDTAMELRETACEAKGLGNMLLEARCAIVIGARADQGGARCQQLPAARDVGEVLLLVLGQQDEPLLVGRQ